MAEATIAEATIAPGMVLVNVSASLPTAVVDAPGVVATEASWALLATGTNQLACPKLDCHGT